MLGIFKGIAIAKTFQWIWENFGKEIVTESTQRAWRKVEFNRAAQKYVEDLKDLYGYIRILDMTAPISLEGLFTHVNVLHTPSAFRRRKIEQLEEIYLGKTSYGEVAETGKDALQAVKQYNKLFILGKPGAGKTTLLKYLVLYALSGKIDRIPSFVPLRLFSESDCSLFEFITHQFKICDFPDAAPFIEYLLKHNRVILLCDGLDEVNVSHGIQDRVIGELVDFSNEYNENQFLITCRVAASEYCFEAFTPVEMADFEKDQIQTFITNWFTYSQSVDGIANRMLDSAEKTAEHFIEEFEKQDNSRLYDLARSPLILTLLCIAYETTLEFPNRRSEIYEEAFNTLLRKWDATRKVRRDEIYHKLTLGRKRQMFARIAYETFQNNEYLFRQHRLEQQIVTYLQCLPPFDTTEDIDGELVLKTIEAQHGIFVERAKGLHSFSHLTFQEYFTARYIAEHTNKGTLEGLIHNHFIDPNWREVFLLVAEMLDEADEFFEIFLGALDAYAVQDDRLKALLIKVEREANEMQSTAPPVTKRFAMLRCIFESSNKLQEAANTCSDITLNAFFAAINATTTADAYDTYRDVHPANMAHAITAVAYAADAADAVHTTHTVRNAIQFSIKQEFYALAQILEELSVPSETDPRERWKTFSNTLVKIFKTHLPVAEYEFTIDQYRYITNYLEAITLLLKCLENASVFDRNSIKERLLKVPYADMQK